MEDWEGERFIHIFYFGVISFHTRKTVLGIPSQNRFVYSLKVALGFISQSHFFF